MTSNHHTRMLREVATEYAAVHSPPTSNHEATRLLIAAAFEAGYMAHVQGARHNLGAGNSSDDTRSTP